MADHHAGGSEPSGLMLRAAVLELPQAVSVADIEQAAPLGTPDEVQRAIGEAPTEKDQLVRAIQ